MNELKKIPTEQLVSELLSRGCLKVNTDTVAQLAERYGMSKASIARRVRAGEFGETINAGPRTHLVTAAGVAKFDADHTGPAHDGKVGTYRPRRRTQHRDPGPI